MPTSTNMAQLTGTLRPRPASQNQVSHFTVSRPSRTSIALPAQCRAHQRIQEHPVRAASSSTFRCSPGLICASHQRRSAWTCRYNNWARPLEPAWWAWLQLQVWLCPWPVPLIWCAARAASPYTFESKRLQYSLQRHFIWPQVDLCT